MIDISLVDKFLSNETAVAMAILCIVSALFFILKDTIIKMFKGLYGLFWINLEIHHSDEIYIPVSKWISENNDKLRLNRFYRLITMSYKEGNSRKMKQNVVPAYKPCYIKVDGFPLIKIKRDKQEKSNLYIPADTLHISFLSFTRKDLIQRFLKKCQEYNAEGSKIFYESSGQWVEAGYITSTSKPVCKMSKKVKNDIEEFFKKKEWYDSRGLKHRRGYLLHGKPGTGKSSLIAYLAQYFEANLYIFKGTLNSSMQSLMAKVPPGSIIVCEDVDTMILASKRNIRSGDKNHESASGGETAEEPTLTREDSFLEQMGDSILGEILNALDGINSYSDSVFIATTNDIDSLDDAFLRPGRIDSIVELDFLDVAEQQEVVDRFFQADTFKIPSDAVEVSIAKLQSTLLRYINDPNGFRKDFYADEKLKGIPTIPKAVSSTNK